MLGKKNNKKIILDTNFLIAIGDLDLDVLEGVKILCDFPFELFIVDKTINELKKLSSGKTKKSALIALNFIEKNEISIIPTDSTKYVDDLILEIINKDEYVVATQDKELKKKIKSLSVPIIIIRQKKYLQFM